MKRPLAFPPRPARLVKVEMTRLRQIRHFRGSAAHLAEIDVVRADAQNPSCMRRGARWLWSANCIANLPAMHYAQAAA